MTLIQPSAEHGLAPRPEHSPALAEAIEGLAWNALTVASLRMINKPCVPRSERTTARGMRLGTLHTRYPLLTPAVDDWRLLDGVWARVPEVAGRYGVDADALRQGLDEYVRALLVSGWQPSAQDSARLLAMPTLWTPR